MPKKKYKAVQTKPLKSWVDILVEHTPLSKQEAFDAFREANNLRTKDEAQDFTAARDHKDFMRAWHNEEPTGIGLQLLAPAVWNAYKATGAYKALGKEKGSNPSLFAVNEANKGTIEGVLDGLYRTNPKVYEALLKGIAKMSGRKRE